MKKIYDDILKFEPYDSKEALDKDRKEFKGLAEKINKIYEQAEKDVLDVLESAGYLEA